MGIDRKPDTDLPGAVAGQLKTKEQFTTQPIEPATTAFGQGFSLTPLKLAQLHSVLANGGRLVSPHITRGFRSGQALAPAAPASGQQLLKPEVTRTVMSWMESVVDQGVAGCENTGLSHRRENRNGPKGVERYLLTGGQDLQLCGHPASGETSVCGFDCCG